MKQTFENFTRILNRSKQFEFENHTVLVIRDYYNGDEVRLDLSKITPEMFDEIKRREPKYEIWKRCLENIDDWDARTSRVLNVMDRDRCSFEHADKTLFFEIVRQIEDYCWDNDIDRIDIDFTPEDLLVYNGDED